MNISSKIKSVLPEVSFIEAMIIAVITLLLTVMFIPACNAVVNRDRIEAKRADDTKALYGAWCRANNRTDISLNDWILLRSRNLLPNQNNQK